MIDRLWEASGVIHPALVHFPVALLSFGAICVVLGLKWPCMTAVARACLIGGTVSAILAMTTGLGFANYRNMNELSDPLFYHRSGGILTVVCSSFSCFFLLLSNSYYAKAKAWRLGLLLSAALVGYTGHQGGVSLYGENFYSDAVKHVLPSPEVPNNDEDWIPIER